ncbi:MAG: hypothetical protein ABI664_20850 [bacterium]
MAIAYKINAPGTAIAFLFDASRDANSRRNPPGRSPGSGIHSAERSIMHKHFYSGVGAGILFALSAVASPVQAQAPQPNPVRATSPTTQTVAASSKGAPPAAACEAAVRGDSIPVQATPVAVDAAITQAIGDSVKAVFPAESKIFASSAATDPAIPQVVKLTLDTSASTPGEWAMLLKGTTAECTGKVRITAGSK